jgi:NitT/TauT family transport system substrate-binding protein
VSKWQIKDSKTTNTIWHVLIGALVLLLVAAACANDDESKTNSNPEPPNADLETPTPELERIRLPMGFIPNVQFAPFYVAIERGYFAQEGLEIEFEYGFEIDGIKLTAAGQRPFAVASGDQVILARSQGLPVVYVFEWWQRFPVAVVSLAEAGIESPSDLVGRTVGVPELFWASYIGWQALLDAAGVESDEVKLVTIGYTQVASLVEGQVDAAVVYANNEPVLLAQQGLETNLIEVAEYTDIVSNGLVASEKVIAERPELVRRFVRALTRGVQDTLDDPEAAFEICQGYVEGLADNAELGRAVLNASLAYWQADQIGYSEEATWQTAQQAMHSAGLLQEMVEVDQLFSNDFLNQP